MVEPGEKGSLTVAKEQFGAGSGDERPAIKAAIRVMGSLEGWTMEEAIHFYAQFLFDSYEDFFNQMLPGYRQQPESFIDEVRQFLDQHRNGEKFILDAERRLNVLRRS